jgi:hypothetical protein
MEGRRRLQPGPDDRGGPKVRRSLVRAGVVRTPLVPASPAQREKVATLRCAVCERAPVDPAHLVPRKLGGCDHPSCVIALCRTHHRLYDHGQLPLGLHLGGGWVQELAHALLHVSPARLSRALRGLGWE